MRPIIYDVATSLDGFIAGPDGDISQFPFEGKHVTDYQDRLQSYDTVIMGRKTYEFGYGFGLEPGARAYPHMKHYIYSSSLDLPERADVTRVDKNFTDHVSSLRQEKGGAIYLCGGGAFAGLLLKAGLIDRIRLKLAPVVLGRGTPLFDNASHDGFELAVSKSYDYGVVYLEYVKP